MFRFGASNAIAFYKYLVCAIGALMRRTGAADCCGCFGGCGACDTVTISIKVAVKSGGYPNELTGGFKKLKWQVRVTLHVLNMFLWRGWKLRQWDIEGRLTSQVRRQMRVYSPMFFQTFYKRALSGDL